MEARYHPQVPDFVYELFGFFLIALNRYRIFHEYQISLKVSSLSIHKQISSFSSLSDLSYILDLILCFLTVNHY